LKCSLCNVVFPYNNDLKDKAQRIYEPKTIVADGSILLTDSGYIRVKVKTSV
jgi:hypothetical protein